MKEFVAFYEAIFHAMLLKNFVSRLHIVDSISNPIKILYDNVSVVPYSKNLLTTIIEKIYLTCCYKDNANIK